MREALSIASIVPLVNSSNVVTVGLNDSLVYDIPNFNSSLAHTVHALGFSARCHAVHGASIKPWDEDNLGYPLSVSDKLLDVWVTPSEYLRREADYTALSNLMLYSI